MSNSFKIVTIANHFPTQDYYCHKSLFKSVGDNEILILGTGNMEYTGLSDKPRILYNAIKEGKISEKYIVFVDAFDVIFADTVESIMDKFKAFNCPIVIGAERNCFPSNFKKEYDRLQHTSSFKYLNSGVIIGETEAILTVLEAMDAPNLPRDYQDNIKGYTHHFNDQANYMDLYLRQPVKMKLDYQCLIVQNMQDVVEKDIEFLDNGKIKNTETNTIPFIIHWNGSSKSGFSMQPILKHLNLL